MCVEKKKSIGWSSLSLFAHSAIIVVSKWIPNDDAVSSKCADCWWTLTLTFAYTFQFHASLGRSRCWKFAHFSILFPLSPSLARLLLLSIALPSVQDLQLSTATSINHRVDKLMHIPSNAKEKFWLNKFSFYCAHTTRSPFFSLILISPFFPSFEFWLAIKF